MPLPLTDPRWRELRSSYGGTEDVLKWLTEAYRAGGLSEARLGDLINEIQHQGGTSTAMYAVAPHLLELARRAQAKNALALLTHAGLIYVSSRESDAAECPSFLIEEFKKSATVGAAVLSSLLPLATDFDTYKWAVAGLAGAGWHGRNVGDCVPLLCEQCSRRVRRLEFARVDTPPLLSRTVRRTVARGGAGRHRGQAGSMRKRTRHPRAGT